MGRSRKRRRQIQIKSMKGGAADGDDCCEDDSNLNTDASPAPASGASGAPAPAAPAPDGDDSNKSVHANNSHDTGVAFTLDNNISILIDNNTVKLESSDSSFDKFNNDYELFIKINQLLNNKSNSLHEQMGGRIDDSITDVEKTDIMIGGLKLDINPKFRMGYLGKNSSRNYAEHQVTVKNFTKYFLNITFELQILLEKLFKGHNIDQILTDFFSLYVNKLFKVLKPNYITNTKTKLLIIVSNYSIYEITRKIIFSCFEKFVREKILNSDKSASENSSDPDLSNDMILVKLSFSLPQLVDFFVDSFTNLDNLDNNILKPGSNNALIYYYNLKLGNVFNTSVEKKENFALISDELTKIFNGTTEDNKETNHLKFYREKIHKIDKIINDHEDENFGLLIEQIRKIIPGFAITENGLLFESTEFNGLKLTIQPPDLEKRKKKLEEELDEIKGMLASATPAAAPAP